MKHIFLLTLYFSGFGLSACSDKGAQVEASKTWLQVTSPPTQVTIVAKDELFTDEFVCRVIKDTKRGKYYNYPFNAINGLDITGSLNKHETDTKEDTKSTSLGLYL